MLQAMFAGVSGLEAHQVKMDTIGNNISNVNTVGYKAGNVSFEDQLYQTLRGAAAPASGNGPGGQNPTQVGLGVTVGGIETLQTQGSLHLTGKNTNLAIQGNGFFVVSAGNGIQYTRDGTFDLDANGVLVNPANGEKVLGYQADKTGKINAAVGVTPASTLQVPLGSLAAGQQTANLTTTGNLDAGAALLSTKVDVAGNLDQGAGAASTVQNNSTVIDALGNPHTVQTIFSNPTNNPAGAGVPAGATRSWNVAIKVDGSTVYDSAAGKSALYAVGGGWQFADTATGAALGSSLAMDGAAGSNHGPQIPGANGANPLTINLNYATLTNKAAASSLQGTPDGQAGSSPVWTTSIQVYDSLGVAHQINFAYTHATLGAGAPPGATSRWDWTATEGGKPVGDSNQAGNSPLFFATDGSLLNGANQSVKITPANGAVAPFTVTIHNDKLTQIASTSTANAASQDGYASGTLQTFAIGPDGVITGTYTNGQSRALGQVAVATFSNPAGLQKLGNNLLQDTPDSGAASVGAANQAGRGQITSGSLEMSNVDLSTEFTNLIITQRGFQANTRIISVANTMLQDVLEITR